MNKKARVEKIEKTLRVAALKQEDIAIERGFREFFDFYGLVGPYELFSVLDLYEQTGLDLNQRVRQFLAGMKRAEKPEDIDRVRRLIERCKAKMSETTGSSEVVMKS